MVSPIVALAILLFGVSTAKGSATAYVRSNLSLSKAAFTCTPRKNADKTKPPLGETSPGGVAPTSISPIGISPANPENDFLRPLMSRRKWIAASAATSFLALSLPPQPSDAAGSLSYSTYSDPVHGFAIDIPSNWNGPTTQKLPDRRSILLWTPAESSTAPTTLAFLAFTPIRDDFTSLASFGSVSQVAQQTILPKGAIMDETSDVKANLLEARTVSSPSAYVFDYTQIVPPQQPDEIHYRTIFYLAVGATGGAGNVLVTFTLQCLQSEYASRYQSTFDHIISSFRKVAAE
jgi:PsbP